MSKVSELIEQLCPDGVEYRPLGEVGEFLRGSSLQKRNLVSEGVPCIHYGQVYTRYGLSANETFSFLNPDFAAGKRTMKSGDLFVATTSENEKDLGKAVAWLGKKEVVASNDAFIYRHNLDPMYVSYFFDSSYFHDQKYPLITGTKVRRLSGESMAKILVPVPPLEVQREIVRVLDAFIDLEQNLVSELKLRKKQFDHIRRSLVKDSQSVDGKVLRLNEAESEGLVTLGRGNVISKKAIAATPGDYPVYSSSGVGNGEFGRYGEYMFDDERISWSVDGGGRLFYRPAHRYSVTNVSGWMTVNKPSLRVKYLYYVLLSQWENEYFDYTRKAHPSVIREIYSFSVPSVNLQDKVVGKLDAFEVLIGSIEQEIALRRKQYEFYRDELLSFTPKEI